MIEDLVVRDELLALVILVIGVILARLASMATGALLDYLDRRSARLSTTEDSLISPKLIRVVRAVLFWLIVVIAISYALQVLGVGGLSEMLSNVLVFVPQLMVGFTIIVAGHIVGLLASHVVSNLSEELTISSFAPRLAYYIIVVVAVVMGLQHIQVDITFVTLLLSIAFAVTGAGLMLAFALGARQHVANLIARRELSRLVVGERIRIDGIEGEIVEIHSTGVDIATEDGVASVPAARFAQTSVLKLSETDQDG